MVILARLLTGDEVEVHVDDLERATLSSLLTQVEQAINAHPAAFDALLMNGNEGASVPLKHTREHQHTLLSDVCASLEEDLEVFVTIVPDAETASWTLRPGQLWQCKFCRRWRLR